MTLEHILREYLTKNDALVYFDRPKNLEPKFSKNRQRSAKSPNQNICSQTLSKFVRFPESGDKFANTTTLTITSEFDIQSR